MQSLSVPLYRTKALFCGLVQFSLLNDSMSCAVVFQEQLQKKKKKERRKLGEKRSFSTASHEDGSPVQLCKVNEVVRSKELAAKGTLPRKLLHFFWNNLYAMKFHYCAKL